jgi:hypothetical protein
VHGIPQLPESSHACFQVVVLEQVLVRQTHDVGAIQVIAVLELAMKKLHGIGSALRIFVAHDCSPVDL